MRPREERKTACPVFCEARPGIRYPVRKKNISVCIILTCIVCMYMYMAKYGFVFRQFNLFYASFVELLYLLEHVIIYTYHILSVILTMHV